MKHLFIINPAAGKRNAAEWFVPEVQKLMEQKNLEYEICVTQGPGEAERIVKAASALGEPLRVYACGGDGTLNEVVSGAALQPHTAVTAVPLGSGNDFVRLFGADRDRFKNLEALLEPEQAVLDLIRCNGRWCLNICSIGLDARIGTSIDRYKRLPLVTGKGAYLISTLVEVVRGTSQPLQVTVDGVVQEDGRFTMVCICNGRYYGGGFYPVPTAMPDDGLLDVLLVKPVSRLKVASVIGKYAEGRYEELPEMISHRQCKNIVVASPDATAINLDGELLHSNRAEIEIVKGGLRFFYPRGLHWNRGRTE